MTTERELIKKQDDRYIGKKFGMLTVQKITSKTKKSHYRAECLCDCGNTVIRRVDSLVHDRTRSCGCSAFKTGCEHALYRGYEGLSLKRWSKIKKMAEDRGYSIEIDIKYVWDLYEKQGRKCAITEVPIVFSKQNKDNIGTTASLDRINNNKDYIEGNIQWVHKRINIMKGNMSENEFLNICEAVVAKNKKEDIFETQVHYTRKMFYGK